MELFALKKEKGGGIGYTSVTKKPLAAFVTAKVATTGRLGYITRSQLGEAAMLTFRTLAADSGTGTAGIRAAGQGLLTPAGMLGEGAIR